MQSKMRTYKFLVYIVSFTARRCLAATATGPVDDSVAIRPAHCELAPAEARPAIAGSRLPSTRFGDSPPMQGPSATPGQQRAAFPFREQ